MAFHSDLLFAPLLLDCHIFGSVVAHFFLLLVLLSNFFLQQFKDVSGLMFFLMAMLLIVFITAPTVASSNQMLPNLIYHANGRFQTFGLNILCFVSAVSALQCVTALLGT